MVLFPTHTTIFGKDFPPAPEYSTWPRPTSFSLCDPKPYFEFSGLSSPRSIGEAHTKVQGVRKREKRRETQALKAVFPLFSPLPWVGNSVLGFKSGERVREMSPPRPRAGDWGRERESERKDISLQSSVAGKKHPKFYQVNVCVRESVENMWGILRGALLPGKVPRKMSSTTIRRRFESKSSHLLPW